MSFLFGILVSLLSYLIGGGMIGFGIIEYLVKGESLKAILSLGLGSITLLLVEIKNNICDSFD